MNILEAIQEQKSKLNKSETKVANVILKDPISVTRVTIAELARLSDVSEPTVNRFCKKLGAKGFPDFKLRLAQALASGVPYVNKHVKPEDTAFEYLPKIFESTISSLIYAKDKLNPSAVNKAVDQLIQAKQILFFGLGASAPVAMDAQHKFFRFNIPVVAYDDILMQRMSAAGTNTGDVVVIISYTGRTKVLCEVATIARNQGATVLGITAPGSPLSQHCSLLLPVEAPEDTDVYMPMTSRIIHLTILDLLATGVTLRRGADFLDHLKRVKDSLKDTRYPSDA